MMYYIRTPVFCVGIWEIHTSLHPAVTHPPPPSYCMSCSASLDLLRAIDLHDWPLVDALLPHCSGAVIDAAFALCLSQRANLSALRAILLRRPSQRLVDEAFFALAWAGVYPCTQEALSAFVSTDAERDAHRTLQQCRRQKDRVFYLPSPSERERHRELFAKLIPLKAKAGRRTPLQNQMWIDDVLCGEIVSDHRFVVAALLNIPPHTQTSTHTHAHTRTMRPSAHGVAHAFLLALSKENYLMADLLIEIDEGEISPHTRLGRLSLTQQGMDVAWQELVDIEDLRGLKYLLSRCTLRPSQELIDAAYVRFADPQFVARSLAERLSYSRARFSCRGYVTERERLHGFYASLSALFERHVDAELVTREQERHARRAALLNTVGRLHYLDNDIHSFSRIHIRTDEDQREGEREDEREAEGAGEEAMQVEGDGEEEGEREPVVPANTPVPSRKGLVDAVNDFLARRCGLPPLPRRETWRNVGPPASASPQTDSEPALITCTGEPLPSLAVVEREIIELIEREFPRAEQRDDAIEKLTQGIDSLSQQTLVRAWFFLTRFHSHSLSGWLAGFLGEAVSMRSCNPGVAERIVTGLRGIHDPELDAIFAQAEGPMLARIFLNNAFNFALAQPTWRFSSVEARHREQALHTQRAQVLASFLVEQRGVSPASSNEEVLAGMREFAREGISGAGADIDASFVELVDAVTEVAFDVYEDVLKPIVARLHEEKERRSESPSNSSSDENPVLPPQNTPF